MDNQTNHNSADTTTTQEETTPINVAKWAHNKGLVELEQVNAMQDFMEKKIDYATMRSLCG